VSGSGISWAICKSAPRSRQITVPALHHSLFKGRMLFLLPNQQRQHCTTRQKHQDTDSIFSLKCCIAKRHKMCLNYHLFITEPPSFDKLHASDRKGAQHLAINYVYACTYCSLWCGCVRCHVTNGSCYLPSMTWKLMDSIAGIL